MLRLIILSHPEKRKIMCIREQSKSKDLSSRVEWIIQSLGVLCPFVKCSLASSTQNGTRRNLPKDKAVVEQVVKFEHCWIM